MEGGLECCGPWGRKGSNTTERLTELIPFQRDLQRWPHSCISGSQTLPKMKRFVSSFFPCMLPLESFHLIALEIQFSDRLKKVIIFKILFLVFFLLFSFGYCHWQSEGSIHYGSLYFRVEAKVLASFILISVDFFLLSGSAQSGTKAQEKELPLSYLLFPLCLLMS